MLNLLKSNFESFINTIDKINMKNQLNYTIKSLERTEFTTYFYIGLQTLFE